MTDFERTRAELSDARSRLLAAQEALAKARSERSRLAARLDAAKRTATAAADPRAPAADRTVRELNAQLEHATVEERRLEQALKELQSASLDRAKDFGEVSDPRKSIARWSARNPILLLPVRLEARFRHFPASEGVPLHSRDGASAEARDELWVRIYPDECLVDAFEPALSAAEIESGRRFWIEVWASGGIDAQRRTAWRHLVAAHGTGRAAWIVREFAPAGAEPVKADAQDVLLIIATDAPPNAALQTALASYWEAIWLADGAQAATDAALATLKGAVGAAQAAQLITTFVPANLAVQAPPPLKKSDVTAKVVWLTLPTAPAAKSLSWTSPARLHAMPDCFVVRGYQGGRVVFEALGAPIPSPLTAGPDPSAAAGDQLRHDAQGELTLPEEIRWLIDFESALAIGMAVRIQLDPRTVNLDAPIDRLIALGVRLSDSADEARLLLADLLTHHRYGGQGFAFVPQGTPTNNTDAERSGYQRTEDPDAAYDASFTAAGKLDVGARWEDRQDGVWLAQVLSLDPQIFSGVPNATGTDLSEARALNRALWPATFGYAMSTMLHPVFSAEQTEATRWFYTHFVSGRGFLPALRIGKQPYGVLPVSRLSEARWINADLQVKISGTDAPGGVGRFLVGLSRVLAIMRADWTALAAAAIALEKPGDAHQQLLDVIGLHPASVEFHHRYAESTAHLVNYARFEGTATALLEFISGSVSDRELMTLLARLGYGGAPPDALRQLFFGVAQRLNGPLIDDRPLSESAAIRAYTDDGRNYITWLIDAAQTSFEDLRQERGFKGNQPPGALLYLMLRQALLTGYWDKSLTLHHDAGVLNDEAVELARREPVAIHVAGDRASESRYVHLYSTDARVSRANGRTVAERIRLDLAAPAQGDTLAAQLDALKRLAGLPTARLERCLAEHIDTASHRLDAWLLGLANLQLSMLRYSEGGAASGIQLGAFGLLERLQRKSAALLPAQVPAAVQPVFGAEPPLQFDPSNGGYIMAPSLSQATTAAILRAGYLANASPQVPEALAVTLSSQRVRTALGLIEGIRNGQPLGALLGYRLQRGLHEGHAPLELDRFIYPLRQQFPLVANQLTSTQAPGEPIETLEANNVVDGLKLLEHIRTSGSRLYPFGLPLPAASSAEGEAIDAEISALMDAHDALGDLAVAEGVHQAVLGNYDRVSAAMDAYAKGTFPPEPDVVRTPRSGFVLTHRVAIHLDAGADPAASPFAGIPVSPRSQAQPMVNHWLAGILPAPEEVGCRVEWIDPVSGTAQSELVTQLDLRLQPIDLLYIVSLDGTTGMTELDDRIVRRVILHRAPRADAVMTIRHVKRLPAPMKTFFELAPLLRHLQSLLLRSRPLLPSDLSLPGETPRGLDDGQSIDVARVQQAWNGMDTLRQNLEAFDATAQTADAALVAGVEFFARAAQLGIQQVGWSFLYEWRRRVFATLLTRVQDVVDRWTARLTEFAQRYQDYQANQGGMSNAEQFAALGRLDALTAALHLIPPPALASDYEIAILARRDALVAKRTELQNILATTDARVEPLLAAIQNALPFNAFDSEAFSIDDLQGLVDRFGHDLQVRVTALIKELVKRLAAATKQLEASGATAEPAAKVQALQEAGAALLGADFKLIPRFTLAATQEAELSNAYVQGSNGALTQYLTSTKQVDFPVEDWLHGVARVREKLFAWEQMTVLAATLSDTEPALLPVQLPFKAGASWLALEFDPQTEPDGERLLLTSHHAVQPNAAEATCGVLIDEWTEVVPRTNETAALSFHYDAPGSEPPQCWLLAMPPRLDGEWAWEDLVGAIEEAMDLAHLRAVEPAHVETLPYARLLPATTSPVTASGISIATNYARVNDVTRFMEEMAGG